MFFSDGFVTLDSSVPPTDQRARFFRILAQLPMELQMKLCNVSFGLALHFVSVTNTESALRRVAAKLGKTS